ncbi:unnamed protein product [Meganyctiphanes norvegica]|uniref:G-protein coupled receptors family 2 profile 2 domain-containing protein n=1 Tax=Meganyctiphanes norvegica TaxID=48144 RepID=A0AAV2Q2U5_MEGNR
MLFLHSTIISLVLCSVGLSNAQSVHDVGVDEYHYGDYQFEYDAVPAGRGNRRNIRRLEAFSRVQDPIVNDDYEYLTDGATLPLCCPPLRVYDSHQNNCSNPPQGWIWNPKLSGEPSAQFVYRGFPKCKMGDPVMIYQKLVNFDMGEALLPSYISLERIVSTQYCVTKEYRRYDPEVCEAHQTKLYVCLDKKPVEPGLQWTGVAVAHLFLVLTLIAFFLVRDLRTLQGQYMICFLISLLLYNICLLPGSVLTLEITFVSCVSLGAVKYFFFCGVVLWFNVICFDVWRTLKQRQDIGSRKRFLLYSVYTWVVGALLTTVVLVMPYVNGEPRDSDLMETDTHLCKLKTDINMVLQLVETLVMLVNLAFLSMATAAICKYTKFGNGLPRCDATLCLKQSWKLFIIMVGHTLIDVPDNILEIQVVDLWRYVLLESLALFAVFAYRKTVLKMLYRCICRTPCYNPEDDESTPQEKMQLDTVH